MQGQRNCRITGAVVICLVLLSACVSAGAAQTSAAADKKISLDLHNADLRDVIRLIAETGGVNIVASGEVQGTVTVRLVEVPWEQALDVILKNAGLAQERQGNMIRVAPLERFTSERQERLRSQHVQRQTEPTVTHVVPINYAKAADMKAHLEKVLGSCAVISVDTRTNTLLLTGTPSCLRLYENAR
jgi:type IV pilus assembly protein PilQ